MLIMVIIIIIIGIVIIVILYHHRHHCHHHYHCCHHRHQLTNFKRLSNLRGNSLRNAASVAYAQVLAPHHGWIIRQAVAAGMYALPSKSQLLKKLNEEGVCPQIQTLRIIHFAPKLISLSLSLSLSFTHIQMLLQPGHTFRALLPHQHPLFIMLKSCTSQRIWESIGDLV